MASCSVPKNLYTITFEQSFFIYVIDPLSFLSFISFPQVVFFFLHFVFKGDVVVFHMAWISPFFSWRPAGHSPGHLRGLVRRLWLLHLVP